MKALSLNELRTLVQELQDVFSGAQLQEVLVNERGLLLGFYKGATLWLLLDLVNPLPFLMWFEKRPSFVKGKPKPVSLFLISHGENAIWKSIHLIEDFGRVLKLELQRGDLLCELEFRLIPRQVNLIVRSENKSIAWNKPKDLNMQNTEMGTVLTPSPLRSVDELREEWLQSQSGSQGNKPKADPQVVWEKQRQKDIEKKTKALEGIESQLAEDEAERWRELGVWLQQGQVGTSPALDLLEQIQSQDLGERIQFAFVKAKQLQAKKQGARERIQILKDEIESLKNAKFKPKTALPGSAHRMQQADVKGRKLELEEGAFAFIGRSAADNLALLRKAKAWDYWLHLKDYPGAHAIIHRNKDQVITAQDISRVAQWVAKESLQGKGGVAGQKLQVVWVECRFVKPIKGDKLGRVTYHSEKSLLVSL